MNTSYKLKNLLYYYSILGGICMQLCAYRPVGLQSSGNSCYMNSLLQILASIAPINNKLSTLSYNYYINRIDQIGNSILDSPSTENLKRFDLQELPQKASLAQAVVNTIQSINTHKDTKTEKVWTHLQAIMQVKTGRAQGSQEDTTEAWQAVLDALAIDPDILKTINNALQIKEGSKEEIIDYYSPLLFTFGNVNLENGRYFNFKSLEQSIHYNIIIKKVQLSSVSPYLVIAIPRVYQNKKTNVIEKDITSMSIPTTIQMQRYTTETKNNQFGYHLHAMARHYGPASDSGHYVAYIRGQDSWYYCNDATITKIESEANMLKEVAQGVYLVVYKQGPAPVFQQSNNQEISSDVKQKNSQQSSFNSPAQSQGSLKKYLQDLAYWLNNLADALVQ